MEVSGDYTVTGEVERQGYVYQDVEEEEIAEGETMN